MWKMMFGVRRSGHCGKPQVAGPTLEVLEDRRLLSSMPLLPGPLSGLAGLNALLGPHEASGRAAHPHASLTGALLPLLGNPTATPTTIPPAPFNQDVNPYGVAFVPKGFAPGGPLQPGDILVSNFNNGTSNFQGTGTTIVRITPAGQTTLFFQGPQGLGLTTALGVLRKGFVIVGNLPTSDGTSATAQQGSLIVLDRFGFPVLNLANAAFLDGPWDATLVDHGDTAQVFVSNVLSGTVTRLDLRVTADGVTVRGAVQIASGYAHTSDPVALELGPTGLAYDAKRDILYVASTDDNKIFKITHAARRQTDAGTGDLVYEDDAHLRGPLGLALAPNGHLITYNGDAVNPPMNNSQINMLVEFTPGGAFVAQKQVDGSQDGAAFGLAIGTAGRKITVAAVDDVTNQLIEWTVTV
jgi:hypothetical protein